MTVHQAKPPMPSGDLPSFMGSFIAESSAMRDVLRRLDWYAEAQTPVILVGETGTGKTTLAELIHRLSRRPGTFVPSSVTELDPNLQRSQIFGHEKGAFTGATERHIGLLEEAGEGTVLLDEGQRLRRATQEMLLRALDRAVFRRVGGSRDLPFRARLIIAFAESPDELVRRGRLLPEFRSRLGFSIIPLPRLEERREDVPALAEGFLRQVPGVTGVPVPTQLAPELLRLFQVASWPWNVRQLGKVIEEGCLRARGNEVLTPEHVADLVSLPVRFERRGNFAVNARAVRLALEVTGGRVTRASKLLNTSRTTIHSYLRRCGGGVRVSRFARTKSPTEQFPSPS